MPNYAGEDGRRFRRSRSPDYRRSPRRNTSSNNRNSKNYHYSRNAKFLRDTKERPAEVKSESEDELEPITADVERFRNDFLREEETATVRVPAPAQADSSPEKPNFETSGLLTQDANLKNGVVLKYAEPADSAQPTEGWRLYIFKPPQEVPIQVVRLRTPTLLVGKEQRVVDLLMPHPSVGRQHAALQFRHTSKGVKPYIMDLDSVNATWLNGKKIEAARYYELREKDILRFGLSSREVVVVRDAAAQVADVDLQELAEKDIQERRRRLAEESKRLVEREEKKKQERAALLAKGRW